MGRFALAVFLVAAGCVSGEPAQIEVDSGTPRPKAGDTCGTFGAKWPAGVACEPAVVTQFGTLPPRFALDCQRGRFEQVRCSVGDCEETTSGHVVCDTSSPREGDRCFAANEGNAACSSDAGVRFKCLDAGYVGTVCPGGCSVSGGSVTCQ